MPNCVVFSERAIVALLSETLEKISTETGGVFLGYRRGETWYIIESIDPGPNSIFQPCYFEYDTAYVNHLARKVNRLYRDPLELIGLWHRHPGSLDRFSATDDGTNKEYARLNAAGAISAIVNIDPDFRLTVYSVTVPLNYEIVPNIKIGDGYIPTNLLTYASGRVLQAKINGGRLPASKKKEDLIAEACDKIGEKAGIFVDSNPRQASAATRGATFGSIFLRDRKTVRKFRDKYRKPVEATDQDIDALLELLAGDLQFFSEAGYEFVMRKNDAGVLEFNETCSNPSQSPASFEFFMAGNHLRFNHNEKSYLYKPGLFRKICEAYIAAGGNGR
jgi:integrative and conjugative element protein (TIGR02256 family)